MKQTADFSDLTTRFISAMVLLVITGFSLWQGDSIFYTCLIISAALMGWEISTMHGGSPRLAILTCILTGFCTYVAFFPIGLDPMLMSIGQIALVLLITGLHKKAKSTIFLSTLIIIFATIALGNFRQEQGLVLTLWVLLCVIASDIGGYFAGKTFGGPKLWARISPKKTWSGTLGGWGLAVAVGVIFSIWAEYTYILVPASILVAIAAQSGDLAESAMKRRAGIKDSSNLIPGHGGLLDRFDGVIGVSILIFIIDITGFL